MVAKDRDPRYLTFVNPVPPKGVTVFARIAAELDRRRPDIPLLVVEARGTADGLSRTRVDLSRRGRPAPDGEHASTRQRDFYRGGPRRPDAVGVGGERRPWWAREAMANGLPVLASDRGRLPETLGGSGFVFSLPQRCTPPTYAKRPTPREAWRPWLGDG